jgi:leucyl/phenylalanyl-tRNA--protein transferase
MVDRTDPVERRPIEPPWSRYEFPDPASAPGGEDLIAVGADLEPGTLLAAYRAGLFPMPVDPRRRRSKVAWYSPDPRGIIPLDGFKVSRSMRASARRFDVTRDAAFTDVVRLCGDPSRSGHWITADIIAAYVRLFELGWAHSVEVWHDGQLVGGVYGVRAGGLFAGESMFHHRTDASKVALMALVADLRDDGATLFDVQWTTPHLSSLGAIDITRDDYLDRLRLAVAG